MGSGGSFNSFTDISSASRTAYFCLEMKFQCSNALEKLKRQQDSCLQFQLANCNYTHTPHSSATTNPWLDTVDQPSDQFQHWRTCTSRISTNFRNRTKEIIQKHYGIMVLLPKWGTNYFIIPDAPAAPSPVAVVYHELLQLPDPPQRHPSEAQRSPQSPLAVAASPEPRGRRIHALSRRWRRKKNSPPRR